MTGNSLYGEGTPEILSKKTAFGGGLLTAVAGLAGKYTRLSYYTGSPKRLAAGLMALLFLISVISVFALVVFHEIFNFTSSNSAIYVLKKDGAIELRRDLLVEESEHLLFMINVNCIFDYYMRALAVVRNRPTLELTWDEDEGTGDIKQYRPDGTMLTLTLSRFREEGLKAKGVFIGGDLPYGDVSRSLVRNTSGFAYYDGKRWNHIWCALNEGFKIYGTERTIMPAMWKYEGSRVRRNTRDMVIIESIHETDEGGGVRFRMLRRVVFRAQDDYFVLLTRFINISPFLLIYGYSAGDEPWVGHYYGMSGGDVGWVEGGLIETEQFISPTGNRYAGFWDVGNKAAGEEQVYSGYANFVEWITPLPNQVFFSNTLERCCSEQTPLSSMDNRVINIMWLEQALSPGQSRDYILAFGKATFDHASQSLKKPEVVLDESLKKETLTD